MPFPELTLRFKNAINNAPPPPPPSLNFVQNQWTPPPPHEFRIPSTVGAAECDQVKF